MIVWHLWFTLKPRAAEAYLAHCAALRGALTAVDGIDASDIYRDPRDSDKRFVVMVFRDRATATAYPLSAERRAFLADVEGLYESVDRWTIDEATSVTDGLAARS